MLPGGEKRGNAVRFTKMHGIGNDYIYVNCFREKVEDPEALSVRISDRHFGVGSDGLILIKSSDKADFCMEIYNADGSRAKMCGNGIRCVAKYVYDYGLTDKTQITIDTDSGIKTLDLTVENGKVSLVRVDMGAPRFEAELVPVIADTETVINQRKMIGDAEYDITCLSTGSAHCVVPVEDPDALDLEKIGPVFENHPMFPMRINTEFIRVLDRKTVQMRVWERGSGETLACGTGASAVAAACAINGWTDDDVTVILRGGKLHIFWDREKNTIIMTGPAETVFDGEWDTGRNQ